jgi:hypothetical protein
MNAPDWADVQEWENLDVVRHYVSKAHWLVRDIDPMASGYAYVCYLRSTETHNYINVEGHNMNGYQFDCIVMMPAGLVRDYPDRAAEFVIHRASEALTNARP